MFLDDALLEICRECENPFTIETIRESYSKIFELFNDKIIEKLSRINPKNLSDEFIKNTFLQLDLSTKIASEKFDNECYGQILLDKNEFKNYVIMRSNIDHVSAESFAKIVKIMKWNNND